MNFEIQGLSWELLVEVANRLNAKIEEVLDKALRVGLEKLGQDNSVIQAQSTSINHASDSVSAGKRFAGRLTKGISSAVKEAEEFIRSHYREMTDKQLADKLGYALAITCKKSCRDS